MEKRVRLEIPLGLGKTHLYLKVVENQTEAFWDKECMKSIPQTEKNFSFEVEIPEQVELIGITPPSQEVICEKIANNWIWLFHTGWQVSSLKKVIINLNGNIQEVAVCNSRPDVEEWMSHKENDWWFDVPWGLVIYVTDFKTYGILHWNPEFSK